MKKSFTLLYLNIVLILGLSLSANAQTITPVYISDDIITFSGTNYLVYPIQGLQELVQYKIYSGSMDHLVDSITTDGDIPVSSSYAIKGSNLKAGLNYLSVTGTFVNKVSKIPDNTITVDGILNENYALKNVLGHATNGVSNSVMFGLLWDDIYLYVGVQVIDNTPNSTTTGYMDYNYDSVELLFDPMNFRSNYFSYDTIYCPGPCAKVRQFRVNYNSPINTFAVWPPERYSAGIRTATTTFSGKSGLRSENNFTTSMNGTGYTVEFAIPWSTFYGTYTVPGIGTNFGLEVACNDNQTGEYARATQMFWPIYDNFGWSNSINFANIQLEGMRTFSGTNLASGDEALVGTFTALGINFPVVPLMQLSGTLSQLLPILVFLLRCKCLCFLRPISLPM